MAALRRRDRRGRDVHPDAVGGGGRRALPDRDDRPLTGPPEGGPLRSALMHDAITDVPGIEVGHETDTSAVTGCTAVVCRAGAVAGVAVRGAAPGTRETD